jgi:molybdopterin synthase catalytic subunit
LETAKLIEITEKVISPDSIIKKIKNDCSGCVVTYVGLIRDNSQGKKVISVTYRDVTGKAKQVLNDIALEALMKWPVEDIVIFHRVGELHVGDVNLVVAVAAAHREAGFDACRHIIDQFKQRLPTQKVETYVDGSTLVSGIT